MMHRMRAWVAGAAALTLLSLAGPAMAQPGIEPPVEDRPVIQLALLLDTSGSMNGLIQQAKTQLWSIVTQFSTAQKDGARPRLQVALYEYGKQTLPAEQGYLRRILPLTDDLDTVSAELFALKTNGGEEYCGWVIKEATDALAWSAHPSAVKAIFIAGNEPFTQGPVAYAQACTDALAREITINTIHCGPEAFGVTGKWKDGATLGGGTFLCIDHGKALPDIAAPQDAEIARLNAALNATYIPFGKEGAAGMANQAAQDANARQIGAGNLAMRANAKATTLYANARWDLVDAVKNGTKLEEVKTDDLPAALQQMTLAERTAHVNTQAAARAQYQAQLLQLGAERQQFVDAELKKLGQADPTLQTALIDAIRRQAVAKGYTFTPPAPAPEVKPAP